MLGLAASTAVNAINNVRWAAQEVFWYDSCRLVGGTLYSSAGA